jgi:hypothetical protein
MNSHILQPFYTGKVVALFLLLTYVIKVLTQILMSLNKRRFCQNGRHQKIGITNSGGILHHSARVRKQKTLKILCFVICVEDYHKLTQIQFLIQSPLCNLTSVLTKTSLAYSLLNSSKPTCLGRDVVLHEPTA